MVTTLTTIFEDLRERGGLKASDLANFTGNSPALVGRWTDGSSRPHPKTQILISDLSYVVSRLSELYTAEETRFWLYARNPLLDEARPIDKIFDNQVEEVLTVIEQLSEGTYL